MILNGFWKLCKTSIKEWRDDHGSLLAAAISYYAVFSIIPIFILLTSLAGFFKETAAIEQEILRQVQTIFSDRAAESVQSFLSLTQESGAGIASLFSAILLLVIASGVFVQIQIALNIIWKVNRKRGLVGNMVRKRFLSFAMMMGLGSLLLVFFIFNTTVQFLNSTVSGILPQYQHVFLWGIITESISVILFSLFFGLLYRFIPDAPVQWRDVWSGSILTALLFAGGRFLFMHFFGRIDVSSTYGAAGSLVVILVWISLSAHIFLFGANFTHVYAKRYGSIREK